MEQTEFITSIMDGNFKNLPEVKKRIAAQHDIFTNNFDITGYLKVENGPGDTCEGKCSAVSLILLGAGRHPQESKLYCDFLDLLIENHGLQNVVSAVEEASISVTTEHVKQPGEISEILASGKTDCVEIYPTEEINNYLQRRVIMANRKKYRSSAAVVRARREGKRSSCGNG